LNFFKKGSLEAEAEFIPPIAEGLSTGSNRFVGNTGDTIFLDDRRLSFYSFISVFVISSFSIMNTALQYKLLYM